MRRLGLAAALAVLLALPATAQMRGGGFAGRGGGFSPRTGGFVPHASGFAPRGAFGHPGFGFGFGGFGSFGHNPRFFFGFGNRFCGGFGCNPFFRRRFFGPQFIPVPIYAGYPYDYAPPVYVAAPYAQPAPNNPYPVEYQQPVAAPAPQVSADHDEVVRLQQEVADLKAQEAPHTKAEEPPATVLVFKDKRVKEVQDYAIVGNALWVLTPQSAKKILLSEIDIPATVSANEERGVWFRAPK